MVRGQVFLHWWWWCACVCVYVLYMDVAKAIDVTMASPWPSAKLWPRRMVCLHSRPYWLVWPPQFAWSSHRSLLPCVRTKCDMLVRRSFGWAPSMSIHEQRAE